VEYRITGQPNWKPAVVVKVNEGAGKSEHEATFDLRLDEDQSLVTAAKLDELQFRAVST
jgi:hypothetical protein